MIDVAPFSTGGNPSVDREVGGMMVCGFLMAHRATLVVRMAQLSTLDGWSFMGPAGLFFVAVAVTVRALFRLLERLERPFHPSHRLIRVTDSTLPVHSKT